MNRNPVYGGEEGVAKSRIILFGKSKGRVDCVHNTRKGGGVFKECKK